VRRPTALIALCCALVLAPAIATPAQAQTPGGAYADPAVASQVELSRRLAPLRVAADAAAALGGESEASVYSGVVMDAAANTVTVYLTDRTAESRFRRAMSAAADTASPGQLRFATGRYSQRDLFAARTQLQQQSAQLGVVMILVPADGSGLRITARNADAARTGLANLRSASKSASSTPLSALTADGTLTIVTGSGAVPRSRTRDWAPWIAGAALSDWTTSETKVFQCTSGLPARRISDGHSFIVTAGHCFADGVDVHTGWWNGGRTYVGRVSYRRPELDALIIDTAATGVTGGREWDGPADNIYPVTGSSNSQVGDMLCQDGFESKIICGLKVEGSASWLINGNLPWVNGKMADTINGGIASRSGDSGGLVFNYNNVTRQARGIVSASGGPGLQNELLFPEAGDLLSTFSLTLASSTVR
jgi:hypothetical protein